MTTYLERLNNAIVRLAMVSGRGSKAAELLQAWQANVWDGHLRDAGPLVYLLWGALQGYWARYRLLYGELTAAERSGLPTPEDLRPRAATLLSDAQRQVVESNLAAARGAANAAYGLEDVVVRVYRGAQGVAWTVILPVLAGLYFLLKKAKD